MRQGLALGLEAGDDRLGVHAQLDDLEGDAAAHRCFLLGHINHAAAALADLFQQLVAADEVAGFFRHRREAVGQGGRLGGGGGRRFTRIGGQETASRFMGTDQRLDPGAHFRVFGTSAVEVRGALRHRAPLQSGIEDFNFPIGLAAHAVSD